MLFTGRLVKAPQALAMGLVARAGDGAWSAGARALELATRSALPAPPALAQIKEVVLAGADLLESAPGPGAQGFQLLFDSQDQKEAHARLPGETPNELPGK
ncbi:hypothetical protein [Pseudomonas aeruginosa]|uniref:hypothetical protein n=1 Tax=Pseudomonas aeruginosa TaxID=287 RepID=UPI003D9C3092